MKNLYILFAALFLSASLSAQNVGVDQSAPTNKLDVNGNLSVGSTYSGTETAPANGAIFEGNVGIGTPSPIRLLQISGPEGNFFVHPNFGPVNKTVLLGSFEGITGGAQVRFKGSASDFIDIGNDSSSNFVIETNDNVQFQVNQSGAVGVGTSLGIRTQAPTTDLFIQQSNSLFPNPSTGGIALNDGGSTWNIWHSNDYLSFAFAGTRVAYINNSTGAFVTTSDLRLKQNIEPMENTLDRVLQLRPVSYHYLSQSTEEPKVQGFIAQEVEPLFPEAVHTDKGGDLRGISYADFSVIAIKAIQEQQEIIEAQQAVIEDLVKRIEALEEK